MRSVSYVAVEGSTGASATSIPITATQGAQASVIVSVTGDVAAAGTVSIDASNDVAPGFPAVGFTPTTWVAISNASVNISGNGSYIIPVQSLSYQFIRIVWTQTAGSGGVITATVNISG